MSLPLIRYKLHRWDDGQYEVRWLCGSWWLLVWGPTSERSAREKMDYLAKMPL